MKKGMDVILSLQTGKVWTEQHLANAMRQDENDGRIMVYYARAGYINVVKNICKDAWREIEKTERGTEERANLFYNLAQKIATVQY